MTESVALPPTSREASCPSLTAIIPFAAIGRPACPKCRAPMMLVSIELAGPGVDLNTFECAICNQS